MIDWRRLGIVVLVLSCGKSVPIEDKPCPCLAGYVCCSAKKLCVRAGAACEASDGGVDHGATGEGGVASGDGAVDQGAVDQRPPSGPNEPTTDRWTRMSAENGPEPADSALWTGTEMIVWAGSTGARYNPATDRWTTMATLRSPRAGNHTAVWTGKEMIVWPGGKESPGGRYDPVTDSWRVMSIENAPESRGSYAAVWTGSQMFIWGGGPAGGGRYDPVADKWSAVSSAGAPTSPMYLSAFWIGREAFLWGGYGPGGILRAGLGLYDPVADAWRSIPEAGAPDPRVFFAAVFTGKEVFIAGGNHAVPPNGSFEPAGDAAAYDVATEKWRPITTTDGGWSLINVWAEGAGTQGTGLVLCLGVGVYDPPSNKWWTMSRQDAPPSAFAKVAAVWTGRELLVWMSNADMGMEPVIKGGWRYRP